MNILLLTRYHRLAASSRVRFLQYLPALEAAGHRVEVRPLLSEAYVRALYGGGTGGGGRGRLAIAAAYLRRIGDLATATADLIWLEKEALPFVPAWLERLFWRRPVAVDLDDAVFHRYEAIPGLAGKIDGVMARAGLVVAGNAYIAERAAAAGARRVEMLPTVVDLGHYPALPPAGQGFTIGWIGSPVTAPYLEAVRPALSALVREGARLLLIGAGEAALPGLPAERRPWREEREAADLAEIDVGIMPLPDLPFERGKCGYKLIQYMAAGRPTVASPVGVNAALADGGRSGLLPGSAAEWTAALRALRDDPDRRIAMGAAGRALVERHYCLAVAAPRLVSLLESARA
ncbi:MAG: glycosyltransferase family 4 protein [Thalassobaculales bacterium]